MSVTVAMLEKMEAMGLTLAQAIDLAKAWEEGAALPAPSANTLRQRRHRERKRGAVTQGVMDNVTRNASDNATDNSERVSPTPPSEITPIPPLKGGTFPKIPASPEQPKLKTISAWVAEIWEITPKPGRERSGRPSLENALKAAARRGADLAAVKAGIAGYYASPDATKDQGQYAKGVHTVIGSGRWEAFTEGDEPAPPGSDDPWPRRLKGWNINQYWNSEWGPKPGKPGYRGPDIELAA